jgi:membrane associated rhomboid family serine protease
LNEIAIMGIYDREYYRRDGPSFLGAIANTGKVCKWLILINAAAFVLQILTRQRIQISAGWGSYEMMGPGWFTDLFILDTQAVLHGQIWRLLTYSFLHDTGSLWHILFNMLFLWWFGKDMEDIYGPREFLAVYLVSAFLGGVAFVAAKLVDMPGSGAYCLGASGAVTESGSWSSFRLPRTCMGS